MPEDYEKKRRRFFRIRTIDMLQIVCGYDVNKTITPEVSKVFDFSCESPFSDDEGELIKIAFDFIDASKLQAIREFETKTGKKKSLWIWYYPRTVAVFKFQNRLLVSPRNGESLLKEFVKVKTDVKEKIKINPPQK